MTITTGIKDLDRILRGSLEPGRLIIFAGPSTSGMTTLLDTMAVANGIEARNRTLLFDVETSRDQRMNRVVSAQTGIPLVDIQRGKIRGVDAARIAAANATLGHSLAVSHGYTLDRLHGDVDMSRAETVLVDGMRLFSDSPCPVVLGELKAMATDRKMLVVATSPAPRIVDRPLLLDDLQGDAEKAADAVVVIRRDESAGISAASRTALVELSVIKNRSGELGTCEAIARYTHARMFDLPGAGQRAA